MGKGYAIKHGVKNFEEMDFNYRYRFICLIKPNIRMGKILSYIQKILYLVQET